jgi:hypothetical protein
MASYFPPGYFPGGGVGGDFISEGSGTPTQISILIPKTNWREGSAFTATAAFRRRSDASAAMPDDVEYRVECLTTGRTLKDWTAITAAASVEIEILSSYNTLVSQSNAYERKRLVVSSNPDTDTEFNQSIEWRVSSLAL